MKKIFTLIVALVATTTIWAQQSAMTFVGESSFAVSTANVTAKTDTVGFAMKGMTSGDITIPSKSYNMGGKDMTIPSFTIHNAAFSMDMTTMTATFADQTFSETVTVGETQKTITGTSLSGAYKKSTNTLDLVVKFKYGSMPLEATYTVKGYYVKGYTNKLSVSVGGMYNYENSSVTYKLRKYMDADVEKVDVEIPTYVLTGTVMGDLTIGTYTVTGLTYDETKGGYYRDYVNDGLKMYFSAVSNGVASMDSTYTLSKGNQNILVKYVGTAVEITNNFQPGSMPFPITSTFDSAAATGISTVSLPSREGEGGSFNLSGQRVSSSAKGIVIRNGRKYINK